MVPQGHCARKATKPARNLCNGAAERGAAGGSPALVRVPFRVLFWVLLWRCLALGRAGALG